jgi:hypothetical protein
MLLDDDIVSDGKAKASAFPGRLGREEGIEHLFPYFRRNAGAVVPNPDLYAVADARTRAEIAELTDTLRDNLGKIVQHGKRADAIVKNMLLHSREGSGEHRPVDINALVEESLNLAYHGARAVTDDNFARNRNWEAILDRLIKLREREKFNIRLMFQVDTLCHRIPGFNRESSACWMYRHFYRIGEYQSGILDGREETTE